MEGPGKTRIYSPPYNRPTSPPATPGTQAQPPFLSSATHASPQAKRGAFPFAHSPPWEHIQPTGDGHHFKYTRPLSNSVSSRPSTPSGRARNASRESSPDRYPASDSERRILTRKVVEESEFILEEIGTESEYSSETEVVRPYTLEEACSSQGDDEEEEGRGLEADGNIVGGFKNLNCEDDSDPGDEQSRRYRKKKKRWSAGIFKRSHSQSVGSDSDVDDAEALDAHDLGSSARRLRRRVRGPGDRSSLIFEDLPDHHVVEVDEPDDGSHAHDPPLLPSDTEDFTLRDLPFWVLEDPMEIESGSSRPSTRGVI